MELINTWRDRGAAIGAVSGAALSLKGARAGAVAGGCLLPGVGTVLGMATGALLGAATGAALGESVDRDIVASYKCPSCGSSCRLND
jgi:phage tail tape-measure protein